MAADKMVEFFHQSGFYLHYDVFINLAFTDSV